MYTVALNHLRQVRQAQPLWPYHPPPEYSSFNWDLDTMDDVWFKKNIRLTKQEIRRLTPLLNIGSIHYRYRYQCPPEVALCIVCYKLSWPNRIFNMTYLFGRSHAWISTVYNDTIAHLSRRYRPMLRWHPLYTKEKAEHFAEILDKHGGCGVIWAFVDGTFRGFCRSKHAQQMDYSGYKGHGFHWQGVVGPDGILFSLTGPHLGPDNDNKLLAESGVLQKIQEFWPEEGDELFLFGDQAYGVIKGIMSPFGGDRRTIPEPEVFFNDQTSSIRISIE